MSELLNALARWIHIVAGIMWIGMLYFLNFVNGPFTTTMDADTKKNVVPELMPRVLWWFRWGAAYTWATGVLLLILIFYCGGALFQGDASWDAPAIVLVAIVFVAPFAYDKLQLSDLGRNPKVFGTLMFVLVAAVSALMQHWAHFSYRGFNIHVGAMFGTTMAFNVWFRIWPAQRQIIGGVKGTGPAAPPELAALAGARSRHNVYMSVPLIWAMMSSHTEVFAGGRFGIPGGASFGLFLLVVLLGWHGVWQLYRRAGKVHAS